MQTAPFPGIITVRNVDVGALITAGSSTSTSELFCMMRIDILRISVNVPQPFVPSLQPGQTAQLLVQEFPQRTFTCKVVRMANALDPASHKLLTEGQVSNRDRTLLPGRARISRCHVECVALRSLLLVGPKSETNFRGDRHS